MYRTTKDVHFPLSSFVNAQQRIKLESEQINHLHAKLKGLNYKIGKNGDSQQHVTQ